MAGNGGYAGIARRVNPRAKLECWIGQRRLPLVNLHQLGPDPGPVRQVGNFRLRVHVLGDKKGERELLLPVVGLWKFVDLDIDFEAREGMEPEVTWDSWDARVAWRTRSRAFGTGNREREHDASRYSQESGAWSCDLDRPTG